MYVLTVFLKVLLNRNYDIMSVTSFHPGKNVGIFFQVTPVSLP